MCKSTGQMLRLFFPFHIVTLLLYCYGTCMLPLHRCKKPSRARPFLLYLQCLCCLQPVGKVVQTGIDDIPKVLVGSQSRVEVWEGNSYISA